MSPRTTLARLGGLAGRGWAGWQRFWFDPRETSTLGVVRIVYGATIFFWTLSQLPTLLTFYGRTTASCRRLPTWGRVHGPCCRRCRGTCS